MAAFISSDKDFATFRCFSRLQVRVLLHRQDELVRLEQKLEALDEAQEKTDSHQLRTNRRPDLSHESQALLGEVEVKLKQYSMTSQLYVKKEGRRLS